MADFGDTCTRFYPRHQHSWALWLLPQQVMMSECKLKARARAIAQGVKALAAKPGKLSSVWGSNMAEREATRTDSPLTSTGGPQYPSAFMCTHALPHLSMLTLTQSSRSSK